MSDMYYKSPKNAQLLQYNCRKKEILTEKC